MKSGMWNSSQISRHHFRTDWVIVLIAVVCSPLFFYGLGATYLWQDEAQTALLGRSVLAHGFPTVGSGAESLSCCGGRDAGLGGAYFQISWLQAYAAALSSAIFGESSWSARLPFALAGWLCVPLVGWMLRRVGTTVGTARLGSALTAVSVFFIMAARQARYYPLAAAATLLVVGTYATLADYRSADDGRRPGALAFAFGAAACFLVLSFDLTAIGVLGVVACHWLFLEHRSSDAPRKWDRTFWAPWVTAGLVLTAWLMFSATAESRREVGSLLERVPLFPAYYAGQISGHIMPWPVFVALALPFRRGAYQDWESGGPRRGAILLALVIFGGLAGAVLAPLRFYRYIVPIVPIVVALGAISLTVLFHWGRLGRGLACALVVSMVASSAPFVWSQSLVKLVTETFGVTAATGRSHDHGVHLARLIGELKAPPAGPITATVEFLQEHASPGDVIVTDYGELPLKFHTKLAVFGGETQELPRWGCHPEWLWPRDFQQFDSGTATVVDFIEASMRGGTYREVKVPGTDRPWENREEPDQHLFENPGADGPSIVLYARSMSRPVRCRGNHNRQGDESPP